MSTTPPAGPLSDAELDQLTELLEQRGPTALNLEALDGFLAALVCSPESVLPREYLPVLWGEGVPFEDPALASELLALVLRHRDTIASTLGGAQGSDGVYLPILYEDEAGVTPGNDWAKGFMRGVDMRPGAWGPLFENEAEGAAIVPMLMLSHEHDPDAEMRPLPISADQREAILQHMIGGLMQIHRFFAQDRIPQGAAAPALPGTEATVGRNEACPCGSGKKFKFCCGGPATTVH